MSGRKKSKGPRNRPRQTLPRAVKIVGALLGLQAVGLLGTGLFRLILTAPMPNAPVQQTKALLHHLPADTYRALQELAAVSRDSPSLSATFVLLGLLALLAAMGLFRRRSASWVLAMAIQGIYLLIALALYFTTKPKYVGLMMLYGVLMVLYLNYSEVANTFRPHQPQFPGGRAG